MTPAALARARSSREAYASAPSCDRGGAYAEFAVAIMPVLFFSMSIYQLSVLETATALTAHASVVAARAASVVVGDDPSRYGGEAPNSLGTQRTEAVRLAALRAMAPFVLDGTIENVTVTVSGPNGNDVGPKGELTVKVDSTFACRVMLTQEVICKGGKRQLSAEAKIPNQGARYTYSNGGGGA